MNAFNLEIQNLLQEMITKGDIDQEILKHINNDIFENLFVRDNILSKTELKKVIQLLLDVELLKNVHLSKVLDFVLTFYKRQMVFGDTVLSIFCYYILKWTEDPVFEEKVLNELSENEISILIEGEFIYLLNSKSRSNLGINFSDKFYPYISEEMHCRYYSIIGKSIKDGKLIKTEDHKSMIINKHSLKVKLEYIMKYKSTITSSTLFELLKSVNYEGNEVFDSEIVSLLDFEDIAVLIQQDFLPIETRYQLVKTSKLHNKIYQEQQYQAIIKLIDDHEYLFTGTIIELLELLSITLDSNYLFDLLDYYIKNGLVYDLRKLKDYANKRRSKTSQKLFLDLYKSIGNWNKYKIKFPNLEKFKKYLSLEELTSLRITILEEKTRLGLEQ
jgi:hypothetical protein